MRFAIGSNKLFLEIEALEKISMTSKAKNVSRVKITK